MDKVIDLLRHLPYISGFTQIAPECDLVSWHTCRGDEDGADFHEVSEPFEDEAKIPSYIVGLTSQWTKGLISYSIRNSASFTGMSVRTKPKSIYQKSIPTLTAGLTII
jgi:hypothetical protein